MGVPTHVREWFGRHVGAMSAARRAIATRGVEDFSENDWLAFYELYETWRLNERHAGELQALEAEEQAMLKALPRINANGTTYSAPWSLGLRVAACRRLWAEEQHASKFTPLTLS